jgi:hypothetical protein
MGSMLKTKSLDSLLQESQDSGEHSLRRGQFAVMR